MYKKSEEKTELTITATNGMTKISIIDSYFTTIASGLGFLSHKLQPGLYKVRWSTDSDFKDELIEVSGKQKTVNLSGDSLKINSVAPLQNSRYEDSGHLGILNEIIDQPLKTYKSASSQLLIFLKGEGDQDQSVFETLSIHESSGEELVNLASPNINRSSSYAGLSLKLDPGVYRVRVDTGVLGVYEIFVPTCDGWQTQIFLKCDDFYSSSNIFRRPSLRSASILMARVGERFDPKRQDSKWAEMALNALVQRTNVLQARELDDLLYGKFDDPMLGIYAAHLLLRTGSENVDTYNVVCRNLYKLVGPIPDVTALISRSDYRITTEHEWASNYHSQPPSLVDSWDLMVKKSKRRFSIVESGSLSDSIASSVVATRPWLMARNIESLSVQESKLDHISVAEGNRLVKELLGASTSNWNFLEQVNKLDSEVLTPIESAVLSVLTKYGDPKDFSNFDKTLYSNYVDSSEEDLVKKVSNSLKHIQAPSYSIARSIASLKNKLS